MRATRPTRQRFRGAADVAGSVLGIGLLGTGAGTVAAAVTAMAYWAIGRTSWQVGLAVACLLSIAGVAAAASVERVRGPDPREFVLDEVAGQWVALVGVGADWRCVVTAFVLFRVLDIVKPWPLRRLERLPHGVGVVADDLAAGLIALPMVHGVAWWLGGM